MATDKKQLKPVPKGAASKDVAKKGKAKPASGKRKFNLKRSAVAIGHFFRDVVSELKKVSWASKKEFASYTMAVIVFVTIFGAIIFVMDTVLGEGVIFNIMSRIGV